MNHGMLLSIDLQREDIAALPLNQSMKPPGHLLPLHSMPVKDPAEFWIASDSHFCQSPQFLVVSDGKEAIGQAKDICWPVKREFSIPFT